MDRLTKAQMEFMNGYVPANIHDIYEYATGGIHIKPSHEGRFTEYKKRTGKTTEEALHSPDPHVRQMANFARNASHWKHAEGGVVDSEILDPIKTFQMLNPSNRNIVTYAMNQTAQGPRFYKSSSPDMEFSKRNLYNTIRQNPADSIHRVDVPNIAMEEFLKKHQEGGTATGQNDQIMQMIQMYAQYVAEQSGKDPNQVYQQLMQQLQEMKPDEQQAAIQQIAEQVQSLQQQVATQAQEQENPQEQVQEQGQEEPTMAYGGEPQYPFGGALTRSDYFRAPNNVLPSNKFNNTLVNANMLGDPYYSPIGALSAIDSAPTQALAGVLGAVSGLAGSVAGYSSLFNRKKNASGYQNWFHNKSAQAQNMKTPNFNSTVNTSLNPGQTAKKDPFNTNMYNNWKPNMQAPASPVQQQVPASQPVAMQPAGGMFGNGYNNSALAQDVLSGRPQAPYLTTQADGGELPKAQYAGQIEYPIANIRGGNKVSRMHSFTTSDIPDIINVPVEGSSSLTEGMTPAQLKTYNNIKLRNDKKLSNYNNPNVKQLRDYTNQEILNFQYNNSRYANKPFDDVADAYWKDYEKKHSGPDVEMEGLNVGGDERSYNPAPCKGGKCSSLNKEDDGGELFYAQFGAQYSNPGFVDGMGVGQQGYDYGYNNTPLPEAPYNPNQPISGASTNRLAGGNPAINLKPYAPNLNSNTVNKNSKTLNNSNPYMVTGDHIAMNALNGLHAADFALGWFDERSKRKAALRDLADANSTNDLSYVYNPAQTQGNYTTNVQGGAPFLQPNKYKAAQDYGTGIYTSKYGGQPQFASGGQYKVSHDQLLQLLRDGAEIEFL